MYESFLDNQKNQNKIDVGEVIEKILEVLERYSDAEKRQEIEKNLDSLKAYFSEVQESEDRLEKALDEIPEEDLAQEIQDKKNECVQKIGAMKRRLANAIRFEQRKVG